MASAPDMSAMMQTKPSESEKIQGELGGLAQKKYMERVVGTEARPGTARLLTQRIDEMTSPEKMEFQRGRFNAGVQQKFGGMETLRTAALNKATGSGVGENAMRGQFEGLGSALGGGSAAIGLKARTAQEKARVGFAKMGEGMMDNVVTGLGRLGEMESQTAQTKLQAANAEAQNKVATQAGLMKAGSAIMGGLASAAGKSWDKKQGNEARGQSDSYDFNWGKFGGNLGTGFSGVDMGGR